MLTSMKLLKSWACTLSEDNIVLGTCGWSYKEWEGNFYKIKSGQSKLRAYSRVFKTAEIDSTFYRNPSKGTVMGWLKYSPSDFVFTAKLPKTITHDNMLGLKKNVKADLYGYNLMRPLQLGGKLACLLIQLPPKYTYNPQSLEDFFKLLDPTFRYAVEFRNVTWLLPETATFRLLERYAVAYTIVDEPLLPPEIHLPLISLISGGMVKATTFGSTTSTAKKNWMLGLQKCRKLLQAKSKKSTATSTITITVMPRKTYLQLIEKLGLTTEAQKKTRTKNPGKQSS